MIEKKPKETFWDDGTVDLGVGHIGIHICKKSLK